MQTTTNMGLTVWNLPTDFFDHTILASDLIALDAHDHSAGKGVPIGNAGLQSGAVTADKLAASLLSLLVPTGAILAFGGTTAPSGFLMCDGSLYPQVTYSALFARIGNNYGGSGSQFAVPNLQQRFPLGKAASGTGSTLGGSGGQIDHVHTVPGLVIDSITVPGLSIPSLQVQSHVHPLSTNGYASIVFQTEGFFGNPALMIGLGQFYPGQVGTPNFSYVFPDAGSGQSGFWNASGIVNYPPALGGQTDAAAPVTFGSTTGSGATSSSTTRSGTTVSQNPPYLTVNFIIKT